MILNWTDFITEGRTPPQEGSKKSSKTQDWFERNKEKLVTKKVEWKDLPEYGVPEGIIERMKDWPIIMKSPLSNSFYSSEDTTFGFKPDKSFRVANHWNFVSRRDNKLHCVTDQPIENDTVWAIGQFDLSQKHYRIIHTEVDPKWEKKQGQIIQDRLKKLKYLKDPEVIYRKTLFKKQVEEGKISCEIEWEGQYYAGKVAKYTGSDLRIVDESGKTILTKKEMKWNKDKFRDFILYDEFGNRIEDPFKHDF